MIIRQYIWITHFAFISGYHKRTVWSHIKNLGMYLNNGKFRREDLPKLIESIYKHKNKHEK